MNRKTKSRILLPFACMTLVALAATADPQDRRPSGHVDDDYWDQDWSRYGSGERYDRNDHPRKGVRYDDRYTVPYNDRRNGNDRWVPYPDARGCIGGAKCGRYEEIRIRLQDRPVEAIRFRAHDNVGDVSRGHLRVEIDGRQIARDIDVAKNGDYYEIDGRGLRGRTLAINSFAHDEVEVDRVEVLYRGGGGWRR